MRRRIILGSFSKGENVETAVKSNGLWQPVRVGNDAEMEEKTAYEDLG